MFIIEGYTRMTVIGSLWILRGLKRGLQDSLRMENNVHNSCKDAKDVWK